MNPDVAGLRRPLKLLIVDDNPIDVELMVATLKRAGYALAYDAVDTLPELKERLAKDRYDAVLCDHNLRTWTGVDALQAAGGAACSVPFLVVTAALGDEAAVEYIRQGAADYVLKHRLERLPVALGRALREKADREENARLQEVILAGKKEWELTFDTVPDPVVLIDANQRIQRANRATTELLGKAFSELIGRPCHEIFHKGDAPPPDCPHQRMLRTGTQDDPVCEEFHQGKFFNVTVSPLRDSSGALKGCVRVMRDITKAKQAVEALQKSELQYRTLFENANDAIIIVDPEAETILAANSKACETYGYSRDEFVGVSLQQIAKEVPPGKSPIQDLLDRAGDCSFETVHLAKNGTPLQMLVNATVIDYDGHKAILSINRDITHRKRLEEQFRQAQKMEAVGQLAGGIAHDFNNLLGVIIGYTELLGDKLSSGDPARKDVGRIEKAAREAVRIIQQLLAFGHQQALQPRLLDINAVVAETSSMLEHLLREDIRLVIEAGRDLGSVKADPGQMVQILMNLAVNARDAMPHGGTLTIRTAQVEVDGNFVLQHPLVAPGRYVMLEVIDTGVGMDTGTQARIFEPFFTTKQEGQGTGLGLATVYGIVKQSGGHIWVYSEVGRGTTFKVYLPISAALELPQPINPGKVLPRGHETVLLVEDAEPLRQLARLLLESCGYKVLEAGDGAEAAQISERCQDQIDLLLSDVVMPGMSGPELARQLRPSRPNMKVLYTSGYAEQTFRAEGLSERDWVLLAKPYTKEALARKVREVLDPAQANAEVRAAGSGTD